MRYPKIQTLYERDTNGNYGVIPGQLRKPEFRLVKEWLITEKIDGRNHRVMLFPGGHIEHRGRTRRAQFADFMMEGAKKAIDEDLLREVIKPNEDGIYPMTTLYGELYGPKIQGGGKYSSKVRLRLFDIRIGDWWLEWNDVYTLASCLHVDTVPTLLPDCRRLPKSKMELRELFSGYHDFCDSYVAIEDRNEVNVPPEGIVARTVPTLLDRYGNRMMWKLKLKDFK